MPKVLLVANTDWYLANFRLALAELLRQEGWDPVFVSPSGPFVPRLEERSFRWREWRVGRQSVTPWTELGSLRHLQALYREERPGLLHHHTMKPIVYGTAAARRLGLPAVINSVAGLGYVFSAPALRARLIRPVLRRLLRHAAGHPRCSWIFENASDHQRLIRDRVVEAPRCHVIPSVGVDTGRFRPSPEPEGVPVVVFSGRMLWDKGVGVLVEAGRLLKARTGARVLLVGDPDPGNPSSIPEATLRGWHEEGVVEWLGFRLDMERIYREAHVVVLPSMYEGVPTVLLEGAASGRPLVATTIPGCVSVVRDGHNGLLVPPNDAPALAEALEKLVTDAGLRRRLGEAGRETVLDGFRNEDVNRATLELYRGLAEEISRAGVGR